MKTFEEWMHGYCGHAIVPRTNIEQAEMKEAYGAGQASRDAEIAELVAAGQYFAERLQECDEWEACRTEYPRHQTLADKHSATLAKYAEGGKDGN